MTAAYVTIRNTGSQAATVTGVSASLGDASLHETLAENGRMRMQAVDTLSIPAAGEVSLQPGGLHVMLMGLDRTPEAGEVLNLCFSTADALVCTDAPVSRRAPGS
jgi:copper(I)-binding protein